MENTCFTEENKSNFRKITMSELLTNNGDKGRPLWVMIHSKIYDVTKFKHPGGRSLLINDDNEYYEDKGIEFDSVDHSKEAIDERDKLCIGQFEEETEVDKIINDDKKDDEKKDFIYELQHTNAGIHKFESKDNLRAFILTCIIVFLILIIILIY